MTAQRAPGIAFTLGDRLRKARVSAGLDQLELALVMAASRNTVSNYENDHFGPRGPKIMTLRAWAQACGVPLEELVVRDPDIAAGAGRINHQASYASALVDAA